MPDIDHECNKSCFMMDFFQVGDLLRSMKLLVYKPDGPKLEEIAVDINLNPVFLTAIEMIDDEVFLGADGKHLFICQKNR